MKRVCFFNSTKVWGGGEKWHAEVARRLHDRGWPVLIITNPESDLFQYAQSQRLPVLQCRISNVSFLNPVTILRLRHILKVHKIESVILNLSADLKAGGIAAKLAGVPQIVYRRGLDRPIRHTLLNQWLFTNVITNLLVNSEELRRMFLGTQPFMPPVRIQVIYNGLDLQTYDHNVSPPLYTKQSPDEIVIGNVGRLVEQKGQTYLIELAKELQTRNIKFTLLIAGSGKREHELREYARTLQVEKRIRFLGFVDHIRSFMESLDIFILSSLYEGFGYVLTEAMAARKPVIAFRVSSNPEIVDHGHTGFLAELGDVTALADYVETLRVDAELRHRLGSQGRRRVEEQFTLERTLEHVIALLNSGG